MATVRVAIIADVRLYREGLSDALVRRGVDVVGTAGDQSTALDCVTRLSPDLALLDMSTPDAPAILRAIAHLVRAVAIGVAETESHVLACAEAGGAGYVPRDGSVDDLVAALHGALRGEVLCSPAITGSLLRRISELTPRPSLPAQRLTARERQIVELIEQGLSNREIAHRLCIELSTVKNHVHNILEKLGVGRRAQAAALVGSALR
jgi:two-component system nitrate/nitrite response regulator NarL